MSYTDLKFIAEAGQTMRGDIGLAVEMVHAFAEAGATHFKVQMLKPETIATETAESYWQTGPPIRQRTSFAANGLVAYDAWGPVREACDVAKIGFVATPFDLEAVAALRDLDPAAVKIASGDITFFPLIEAVAALGKPTLVSTGAANLTDVQFAVSAFTDGPFVVPMACTLKYPTPVKEARLRRVHQLRDLFGGPIGYSDHTVEFTTGFAAVLAGASWLEKHVTPYPAPNRRDDVGVPDDVMGLGVKDFALYVQHATDAEILLMHDSEEPNELAAQIGARRAARFAVNMPAGSRVNRNTDLTYLRPDPRGDGLSMHLAMLDDLTTTKAVCIGDVLSPDNARPVRQPASGG